MAVYSTFFVAAPDALPRGFPGWKPPLDKPERRTVSNYLGETQTIETQEPLWEDDEPDEDSEPEFGVVAIEGDYGEYLEARLPALVRGVPHWCSKGLTDIEINPLGELTDGNPDLEDCLFAHPSRSAHLLVFRTSVVEKILQPPSQLAEQWAARMSTPEYTHSAEGNNRIDEDWSVDDALFILERLADLVKRSTRGTPLYLLLEW